MAIFSIFSQGVDFKQITLKEALEQAKAQGKMVFMDCYTTWCGPCKMMTEEVFPQKEAGDFFNAHFVNVKFDMEKGEGKELSKQFKIRAIPDLFTFESGGEGNVSGCWRRRTSRVHSSGKERFAERKYIGGIGKGVQDRKDDEKTYVGLCIDVTRYL